MLVDALCDVKQPVSDHRLVLNMMCSLNECFSNAATIISMRVPFVNFSTSQSLLLLQDIRATNENKLVAVTTLLTTALGANTA